MNFKKVGSISLMAVGMFFMSASSIFAGRTKSSEKNKVENSYHSRLRDKKPCAKVNKLKKAEMEICFCTQCGSHLENRHEVCKNKICVLFCKDQKDCFCDVETCLKSSIEKRKEHFLECEVCGSRDVKLVLSDQGFDIFCYNCSGDDIMSTDKNTTECTSSDSEESSCTSSDSEGSSYISSKSESVLHRLRVTDTGELVLCYSDSSRGENGNDCTDKSEPIYKQYHTPKLTVQNVSIFLEDHHHRINQLRKVYNWVFHFRSSNVMYPHPLTFENLSDLETI